MSNEAQAYTADELAIKQDDADNRVTNRDLRWLATLAERDAKHAAEMAEAHKAAIQDCIHECVLVSDELADLGVDDTIANGCLGALRAQLAKVTP